MALSKNFTLPEKCKNHQESALRDRVLNIDQTVSFFNSKQFGSSLIFYHVETGGRLLLTSGRYSGDRSKTTRQSPYQTFKFTLNKEETQKKEQKKNELKEKQEKKKTNGSV